MSDSAATLVVVAPASPSFSRDARTTDASPAPRISTDADAVAVICVRLAAHACRAFAAISQSICAVSRAEFSSSR